MPELYNVFLVQWISVGILLDYDTRIIFVALKLTYPGILKEIPQNCYLN